MITVNENITIPSSWAELSVKQATETIGLIMLLMGGSVSIQTFRLLLLQSLSGYKRSWKKLSAEQMEQLTFNLTYLAEQLTFAIRPQYRNPEMLSILSPELQERLKLNFPMEIYEPEFTEELTTIGSRLEFDPTPNLNFVQNPIPELRLNKSRLYGPLFTIDAHGVVKTDIVAGEFLLANDYVEIYQKSGDNTYLNSLMAVYYRKNRAQFSQVTAEKQSDIFASVDIRQKYLVYLYHCSILEYLTNHSVYGILFKSVGNEKSTGNYSGILYQMAKENYGSIQEISSILISDFISLMFKQLTDAVQYLLQMDKKPQEIAQSLKLSEDQIIEILQYVS